jgi:pimeloyl-ACP methyl ester carboxylesterase
MRRDLRVQFVHGLESSPQGVKARLFAEHFDARTPEMDTHDFEGSIVAQTRALEEFDPQVLVGSSYGGAILVAMIQRGIWRGPTLLLAQAALRRGLPAELPEDQDVWLVHGRRDDIIDAEDSRALARSGTPSRVRLFEIDDVHALQTTVEDGRLVGWVEALGTLARGAEG